MDCPCLGLNENGWVTQNKIRSYDLSRIQPSIISIPSLEYILLDSWFGYAVCASIFAFMQYDYEIKSSSPGKMAAISQKIFSDAFSWMKRVLFWLKLHRSFFVRVQLTVLCIGLDNGSAPNRRQAIIWTKADPIYWRIYAALRGDELSY